jgi:two-component system LytT family sensor kinase
VKRNTKKIVARHTAVQPVVISLWLMQLIFWAAHAVITFFSLTLWYGSAELPYILHAVLQSIVGIGITFPMHWVYRGLWKRSMPTLVLGSILVVMLVSFLATIIRMQSFIWMTIAGEEQWADFGGWYFSGFFIFRRA